MGVNGKKNGLKTMSIVALVIAIAFSLFTAYRTISMMQYEAAGGRVSWEGYPVAILLVVALWAVYYILKKKANIINSDVSVDMVENTQPQNEHPIQYAETSSDTVALITCPACGKQISNQALSCPGCGQPITAKKIKVHFWRKQNVLSGVANTGTVIVDGTVVGSAANGTSFDVMLSAGTHNVVIESKTTGVMSSGRANGTSITIPSDAKGVDVELKLKNDAMSFVGTGGMAIVVGEVNIHR